jgi:hypothetical protein
MKILMTAGYPDEEVKDGKNIEINIRKKKSERYTSRSHVSKLDSISSPKRFRW